MTREQAIGRIEYVIHTEVKWPGSEETAEALEMAVGSGLIQGGSTGEFNGMWEDLMTREQLVTVLYRFAKMMGKA